MYDWIIIILQNGFQRISQLKNNDSSQYQMSFQNNDSSDLDFSIIDKKPPKQAKLNFSVESLLDERSQSQPSQSQPSSPHRNTQSIPKNQQSPSHSRITNANNGSFLNDLQKLQHELSFQTQLYNVYQQQTETLHSHSLNPTNKSCLHAKSNSHLKTTKQQSSNSRLHVDDYGYLVLDFAAQAKKRKKSSKFSDNQKIPNQKLYTQQSTSNSQKLKLSSSSAALTENVSMAIISVKTAKDTKDKNKQKNSSLNKLFSPRIMKSTEKSLSRQKQIFKPITAKSKDPKKQFKSTLQKSQKLSIKSKSPTYHLNTSKKTVISTTLAQTTTHKSNKSYTKSTREGNAYSEYYGFEEMGDSQRLVMKSNCLHSGSDKRISSKDKRGLVKKSNSRSACKKQGFGSPSSKDLTMRFKKKKVNGLGIGGN